MRALDTPSKATTLGLEAIDDGLWSGQGARHCRVNIMPENRRSYPRRIFSMGLPLASSSTSLSMYRMNSIYNPLHN